MNDKDGPIQNLGMTVTYTLGGVFFGLFVGINKNRLKRFWSKVRPNKSCKETKGNNQLHSSNSLENGKFRR